MRELESAVNEIGFVSWVTGMAEQTGYFSLKPYDNGDSVVIDLLGMTIEGVVVEPDQTIMGEIKDNNKSVITVSATSNLDHQEELVGRDIGLACHMRLMSPGGMVSVDLKGGLKPKSEALYYLPEDIASSSKLEIPKFYHPFFGRYGRMTVADSVLFDYVI